MTRALVIAAILMAPDRVGFMVVGPGAETLMTVKRDPHGHCRIQYRTEPGDMVSVWSETGPVDPRICGAFEKQETR